MQVSDLDIEIDRLDVEIDQAVLRSLALLAPVAQDLREVVAAKTMATDLERVGDLARNIAKSAIRLTDRGSSESPTSLRHLATECQEALSRALRAYADFDSDLAREVLDQDDIIDDDEDEVIRGAIRAIHSDPDSSEQAIDLIFIAQSLERVADHATNIAEDVILIAESLNLKHAQKLSS
jgi:phosphate transport system protein